MVRFHDRQSAGEALSQALFKYQDRQDLLVLGLPRGGVPVAYAVAKSLGAPLDVLVVRKLGLPSQPELAMGAIASGGVKILNDEVIGIAGISNASIDEVARKEELELKRREQLYRGDARPLSPRGKCVLIVDDGLATGASMRAAVAAVTKQEPSLIVVAVPVGAPASCSALTSQVDDLVCIRTPDPFQAVGLWYDSFDPTTDEEIQELMLSARELQNSRRPA